MHEKYLWLGLSASVRHQPRVLCCCTCFDGIIACVRKLWTTLKLPLYMLSIFITDCNWRVFFFWCRSNTDLSIVRSLSSLSFKTRFNLCWRLLWTLFWLLAHDLWPLSSLITPYSALTVTQHFASSPPFISDKRTIIPPTCFSYRPREMTGCCFIYGIKNSKTKAELASVILKKEVTYTSEFITSFHLINKRWHVRCSEHVAWAPKQRTSF